MLPLDLILMQPDILILFQIEADEVCGCPLVDDQQKETNKFCRQARKKCIRHVAWQRLRKGEIDLKRVHQVKCFALREILPENITE